MVEGNLRQQNAFRTQGRVDVHSALERVRVVARKDKDTRFTALFHYVYDLKMLEWAFFQLKKEAAPGVDGETWRHYLEDLERNLQDNYWHSTSQTMERFEMTTRMAGL